MGSGTDWADCDACAEIDLAGNQPPKPLSEWRSCRRSEHSTGDHEVVDAFGTVIRWPAHEGDRRRGDGVVFQSRYARRLRRAHFEIDELLAFQSLPDAVRELAVDARRRLADAYRFLTGEPIK